MPSCDNVGRYFPLLIAQQRSRPPLDRIALDHLEAWFEHVASAATQTLAEQSSVDAFEQLLGEAPPWPTPGGPAGSVPRIGSEGVHYLVGRWATLNQWLHTMAIEALGERFAGCSIWWHPGDATRDAAALVVRG